MRRKHPVPQPGDTFARLTILHEVPVPRTLVRETSSSLPFLPLPLYLWGHHRALRQCLAQPPHPELWLRAPRGVQGQWAAPPHARGKPAGRRRA